MKCEKCGHINEKNTIYCSLCGNVINNTQNISDLLSNKNKDNIKNNLVEESLIKKNVLQEEVITNEKSKIFHILTKPISFIRNNKKNNSIILLLLTILLLTIGNFIYNVLNNINNLSNLNYINLLLKNFFIFGGYIITIILIYYLLILVINNKLSIKKITSIICYSLYPFILGVFIIMPLFRLLFNEISIILTILFSIYSLSITTININNNLNIKENIKLYFNTLCISLVIILSYYVFFKII